MNPCLIPGCKKEGIWRLGVRARLIPGAVSKVFPNKGPTSAAFAPDLPSCLCEKHVKNGLLLTLLVEPRKYGATKVRALGAPDNHPHRTVRIQ